MVGVVDIYEAYDDPEPAIATNARERRPVRCGCGREQILAARDRDGMVDPDAVLDIAEPEAHLAEPSHDQ
jgi:hypothetical protein